jgi:hypothetical protein
VTSHIHHLYDRVTSIPANTIKTEQQLTSRPCVPVCLRYANTQQGLLLSGVQRQNDRFCLNAMAVAAGVWGRVERWVSLLAKV